MPRAGESLPEEPSTSTNGLTRVAIAGIAGQLPKSRMVEPKFPGILPEIEAFRDDGTPVTIVFELPQTIEDET